MCTTYLASVLVDELEVYGNVIKPPILARLNPTVPFKTRGNGAVAIKIETDSIENIKEHVIDRVSEMADLQDERTNPGIVFVDEDNFRSEICAFYERAVQTLLSIDDARRVIENLGLDFYAFKNGRGLIGALAAVGAWYTLNDSNSDHTFEFIAYRRRDRWGSKRHIDEASVWDADARTYPVVWDTVDYTLGDIIFAPHSPDPVLFGIRGDSSDSIFEASGMIKSESYKRHTLFLTNQGTDVHYIKASIGEMEEYRSYILDGVVTSDPITIQGGHVFFKLDYELECAAFEPTKSFRDVIRSLIIGDRVRVFGGFKEGALNLEKIEILGIVSELMQNPVCSCGKRMKSMGSGQGFRCKACGKRQIDREPVKIRRLVECGLHEVVPSARRHITKPLIRERGEKTKVYVTR
ncbi:MAG: tRNA(Ile2) 2-agmatinylcytidine synthetase TiaS [Candidatus Syntrophoarchaeum sp. GoM_oil]|nr:MAG: tRNA(Ile2) 2-agmatinylcytidine synthetase TiaS [Candidatus Syntrophoarchaeum sp. GoM_oil]